MKKKTIAPSASFMDFAERISKLGYFDWNIVTNEITWSDGLYRLYGLDPTEFDATLEGFIERVLPEDRPKVQAAVQNAIKSCGNFRSTERIRHASGEIRFLESVGHIVTDGEGNASRLVGCCRDVTDAAIAQTSQAWQIEGLKLLAESAKEMTGGNLDHKPLFSSIAKHLRCEAYTHFHFSGGRLHLQLADGFTEEIEQQIRVLEIGQLLCGLCAEKRELLIVNREELEHHPNAEALWDIGIRAYVGVPLIAQGQLLGTLSFASRTLSEFTPSELDFVQTVGQHIAAVIARDQMESKLRTMEKMDAIGRLAGGVAHDFNNWLTVINTYSELLQMGVGPAESEKAAKAIQEAAQRAAKLTSKLLMFGRNTTTAPKNINLNRVILDSKPLLESLLGEDTLVEFDLLTDLPNIKCDAVCLDQVLVNLVVNAHDAMPDGGRLCVSTKIEESQSEKIKGDGISPNRVVQLSFTDTGIGMSEETIGKALEPFFTTKSEGLGTGLGLSVVYGIVKECDGDIRIESKVGKGTSVILQFPISADLNESTRQRSTSKNSTGGNEIILLVDDDDAVRAATSAMLQEYGFHVLQASGAKQAIQFYEDPRIKISLIVTDLIMPEIGGLELLEAIRTRDPEMKSICMTGYSPDKIQRTDVAQNVLRKPFAARDLVRTIRKVLDCEENP